MTHLSRHMHASGNSLLFAAGNFIVPALLGVLALCPATILASGNDSLKTSFSKQTMASYQQLDGNQIISTIGADGPFADNRKTGASGLSWPKDNPGHVIFSAGLWIVGRHVPSGLLRAATMQYSPEFQPGPLLEMFNTTTNDDADPVSRSADTTYRAYKIQKGDTTSQDYVEWPVGLGAPYLDFNGNGIWDTGVDRPEVHGEQQVWSVLNDASKTQHAMLGLTPPLGIEIRSLYYCYDSPPALDNTMFMEWTLINKSDADYDSVYVGIWSDPDVGDAQDDLPGSDSTLALGFVYNSNDSDYIHGAYPPAAGFTLLAGPVVPGAPSDSALVGGQWIRGYRNLRLSSAVGIAKYSPLDIRGTIARDSTYPWVAYNILRGRAGRTGACIRRPDSSFYPAFWFSGDPVTGQGDLPANFPLGEFRPHDIRMLQSVGPIDLAKGDTQYVAAALVISQRTENLHSVTHLKADVAYVRDFYFNGKVTGVDDGTDAPVPAGFALEQNYPNPFNPTTSIRYTIGVASSQSSIVSDVRLVVYDLLGREVAVLVDEKKEPGSYEVKFFAKGGSASGGDGSSLASGVYFYRLTAGNSVECRKMVLMK
jgi:hypothetical protein